ncbi:DUF1499 domain-containing protein [Tepidibacter hydrothermalis]|uniref:DUF1499 domain-containing protein n=1 Tax=Tepidibacter hydrothermalis TaxID=3036126 RepID=A0ABY8EIV8_9FIRM|nr:DUF1499 domain-containing protein [Tepidibacter hydrothermalis]WFD10813.1 DUF1499 domain-containing protein [Tepidibacter hydrothermalis]
MKVFLTILTLIIVLMVIKNNIIPKNLGVKDGKLAKMPSSPNAVSSQTDIEDKKVEPLKFNGDLEETKTKIINVINNYEGTKIIKNEKNYIYVVFTTGGMKFKDDVEFYFDENSKLIHFRSASRVGYSDMGLNKKRFNEIQKYYYEI